MTEIEDIPPNQQRSDGQNIAEPFFGSKKQMT